jgi:hypothetical protein
MKIRINLLSVNQSNQTDNLIKYQWMKILYQSLSQVIRLELKSK